MKEQTIVRIDMSDGRETIVTRDQVERIVRLNYRNPEEVIKAFDSGARIYSAFAYYELRTQKQDAKQQPKEAT